MAQTEDWLYVSQELEGEWEDTTLSHSHPWDEVEDDARFGWEQAQRPEYSDADWEDVRSELQQRWEQSFPHRGFEDWRTVGEAVRLGFLRAKGGVV